MSKVRIRPNERSAGSISPEYSTWKCMRARCNSPSSTAYAYYGGRGITIDPSWDDYEQFLQDMGRAPKPKHGNGRMTIDRIDGNGPYAAWNCRWASKVCQGRNRPGYVRLDMATARAMRAEYRTGEITYVVLAKKWNVGMSTVSDVVKGRTWKEKQT